MNQKHELARLVCVGFGLWMQFGGFIGIQAGVLDNTASSIHLIYLGTILLMVGLLLSAKAKGRSPLWGGMGLFSIIGVIVLVCLKDYTAKTNN